MAVTNRVDSTIDVFPGTAARGQYPAEGFQLRFTFDAPGDPNVTDLEGICGGGDSGGPAYIKKERRPLCHRRELRPRRPSR